MNRALPCALLALSACASGRTRAPLPAPELVATAPMRADQPPLAQMPPWSAPSIETWTLGNAMVVWFVQVPSSTATVAYCNALAGEDNLQTQGGLPSLTASLLLEGTAAHRGERFAHALAARNAASFAQTSRDGTCVFATAPREELAPLTALLGEAIREPRFEFPAFAAARTAQMDERARDVLSPTSLARQMAFSLVFGGDHVYGRPETGIGPDIRGRTLDAVRAFHREHYRPAVSAVLVAGPDRAEAERAIEQAFASWNSPGSPPLDTRAIGRRAPPRPARMHVIDTGTSAHSHVVVAWPAPAPWGEDAAALSVLGRVIGGMFGSRLNLALREAEGYSYGAFFSHNASREGGLFFASASVEASRTEHAADRVLDEIRRLRRGAVSEPELRSAIALDRAALRDAFSRSASATRWIASIYLAHKPPSALATVDESIRAVTPAAVRAVAQRYFDEDTALVVVAGPRAQIEPGLRQLELAARGMEFWNFQR